MSLYRIRPLVWECVNLSLDWWEAVTPFGKLAYRKYITDPVYVFIDERGNKSQHQGPSEAKLAAEQHYHERLTGHGGCLELVEGGE